MKGFLGWLKKKILHNVILKIASIFLAFLIWFIVAQVGDPKDTRSYSNIQVRLVNTELLDNQNKYYAVLENTDQVRVSVTAPTSVFQTLRPSDIIAEADVSKLTDINTIAITYYALNANAEAISFEGDHEVVKLDVENMASKWIRVAYRTVGTVAEGYIIGSTSSDQTSINISGPESSVSRVGSAFAELNVEGASTNTSANVELHLHDREGNQLDLGNVALSTDHVLLSAEILATKEVPVYASYSGTPADGYMVVGTLEKDVDRILLAGTPTNLATISRITVTSDKVDIGGATETKTFSLNLKDFLPSGIRLADAENNQKINITVTIKASRDRTMEIAPQNIAFTNAPEGYLISLPEEEEDRLPVTLRVFGLSEIINALRASAIAGTVDFAEWMRSSGKTDLQPGIYDVPVSFSLGSEVKILESGTLRVVITKPEE
jgi:YbbR domain-containing protein